MKAIIKAVEKSADALIRAGRYLVATILLACFSAAAGDPGDGYRNAAPAPYNTRCRPWESGINLEAAIGFAESYK